MKLRAVVWTMLGLRNLGEGANRGQRVLVLLVQRDVCGADACRTSQCVKVCSSFLEGKEELEVKKALFKVGLSASARVCGRDIAVVPPFSEYGLCNGATGYRKCRQESAERFAASRVCVREVMLQETAYRVWQQHCLQTGR